MKSTMIILTSPKAWNFTEEQTGNFRAGNSAICYLPFEGVCQSFSNLPTGVQKDGVYDVELGFKQVAGQNGKMSTQLTLVSCTSSSRKVLDWSKITG